MRLHLTLAALGAAGIVGFNCSPDLSHYPPVMGCDTDGGECGGPSGGGEGTGPGMGGAGGGTATGGAPPSTSELQGNVILVTTPSFDLSQATLYSGMANVIGPTPKGTVSAPYGMTGQTFDLMGVTSGSPEWVLVQDTSGGAAGVFSTWTPLNLPILQQVSLPLVSAQVLTNIASDLSSVVGGVSPELAHIVLQVTQGGAPYPNLSVTGGSGSAILVYDIGVGTYSDSATFTGSAGTVILFNSTLQGPSAITLTDQSSKVPYTVTVQAGQGAVTLVPLGL
jgi:hypothetical protein